MVSHPFRKEREMDGAPNVFGDPTAASFELELPHHTHNGLHVFYRRSGHNAVAQIEDVSGASARGAQDFMDALL
jgi:hypothetical protein